MHKTIQIMAKGAKSAKFTKLFMGGEATKNGPWNREVFFLEQRVLVQYNIANQINFYEMSSFSKGIPLRSIDLQ